MHKGEFYELLNRIWFGGWQKQLIDRIISAGRYELGTSLIQSLLTSWMGWRGKKNAGILQNENCGYFGS